MTTGERIKKLAKEKNMNLHQLATLSNVSYNTLYSIVRRNSNRASLDIIQKIANTLGVSLLELYGDNEIDLINRGFTSAERLYLSTNETADQSIERRNLIVELVESILGKSNYAHTIKGIGYAKYYSSFVPDEYILVTPSDFDTLEKDIKEIASLYVNEHCYRYSETTGTVFKPPILEPAIDPQMLIELNNLFKSIPKDNRQMVLDMIKAAVNSSLQNQTETPPEE